MRHVARFAHGDAIRFLAAVLYEAAGLLVVDLLATIRRR
jgi:hypothetical protein